MASSPLPLPIGIPQTPSTTSPPAPDASAPPPSTTPSLLPPSATPSPPADTSPPPALPPPPLPSALPPPPPAASPPPLSSPSPPPPTPLDSPPPLSSPPPPPPPPLAVTPNPSPPDVVSPPPSTNSPPAVPAPVDSPPAPPPSITTLTPPPPPVNSSSPQVPPTSTLSPPTNPSKSTPTSTSKSSSPGPPGSSVKVNSIPPPPNSSGNNSGVTLGIAIGVVAAVVIIGFMMVVVFVQRRKKRHDRYSSVYVLPSTYNSAPASGSSFMQDKSTSGGGGGGEYVHSPLDSSGIANSQTWFTYEELTTATNGFASQNILGAGGFGCVYKGLLKDGRVVAVKKLKDNSGQGDREFKAEVEIISRVHHRYLVSLVGFCITDYQRLLVYEYVPNGTLHYHLHASNKPVMEWSLRVKAACGSAKGIAYLHEDCHPRIIHRDIKTANILLENNFEAKVADFGLAKLAQELEQNTHISTRVMGTFGYMAPEYASSGKLTEKSDVFSFGVVLLELITGRKPVDETLPLGDESLVEWARPLMSEALENQRFDELADPKMQGNYDRGEMFRMIEAAAACVRHSASKRPKMSQVVRALDTISELSDISNGMKPGQSRIYDSREQSAQIRMFQRMAFGSQDFSSEHNYNNSQGSWVSGGRSGQI